MENIVLGFGVAYRPIDKLTLEPDFEWGGWSSFDKQDLDTRLIDVYWTASTWPLFLKAGRSIIPF
jgi:long-subunit fatty acid transport protein